MSTIAKWGSHTFLISSAGMENLSFKADCPYEDMNGYVERRYGWQFDFYTEKKYDMTRNRAAFELEVKADLDSRFGADVLREATRLVKEADMRYASFFYICGKKIFDRKLGLVKAQQEQMRLTKDGRAISCRMALKFRYALETWGGR